MRIVQIILFAFCVVLFTSFSLDSTTVISGNQEPYPIQKLTQESFIGFDAVFLGSPHNIATNAENEIVIFDRSNVSFNIFSSDKKLIRRFGRPGQGPSDFSWDIEFVIDSDGLFYVLDKRNVRMSILDPNGKSINTFRFEKLNIDSKFSVTKSKNILINNPGSVHYIDIYSNEGTLLNSVGEVPELNKNLPRMNIVAAVGYPFYDQEKDQYYIFLQHRPLVIVFDNTGRTVKEISLEMIPEIKDHKNRLPSIEDYTEVIRSYFFTKVVENNGLFYLTIREFLRSENVERYSIYVLNKEFEIRNKYELYDRIIERQAGGRGSDYIFDFRFHISKNGQVIYTTDRRKALTFLFRIK